jgi:CorA-like Mg2+ transporter protein
LVAPERDVLNVLTNRDSPVFSERILIYFRDVYDHLARLTDTLDLYRDQLAGTMDANLSLASNELNRVMRTLTACSIILMSGALIAGIYGMNFDINHPGAALALRLPMGARPDCRGEFGAVALLQAPQVVLSGSEGPGVGRGRQETITVRCDPFLVRSHAVTHSTGEEHADGRLAGAVAIAVAVVCGGVGTLLVMILRLMPRADAAPEAEPMRHLDASGKTPEEAAPPPSGFDT